MRAIVLAGNEHNFCTGAALTAGPDAAKDLAPLDYRYLTVDYQRLFQQLWETETPWSQRSPARSPAPGGCWRSSPTSSSRAEGARWTHVFRTGRGMVPHAGDPYFLPRVIPFHRLNEIAMLSEPVTSETLASWGVVNRCVPAADVVATATRWRCGWRRGQPGARHDQAPTIDARSTATCSPLSKKEHAAQALISTRGNRREGVQALVEQRPAEFTGE